MHQTWPAHACSTVSCHHAFDDDDDDDSDNDDLFI